MKSARIRRNAVAVSAAFLLPLTAVACSSSEDGGSDETVSADEPTQPQGAATSEEMPEDTAEEDTASGPFGPGCSAVPAEGAGSFEGMAQDPVATAASNNPELSTLVSAVTEAGLVDTLNNAEDITVFAPVNDAFAEIPEEDLNALLDNTEQLTDVLTYHVVEGRITPEELPDGTFTTLQGGELTTSGSGESFTVNDTAQIVCGNVQTANATVYLIDSVLMPAS